MSINSLVDQMIPQARTRYYGKYRGVVRDNNDPTQRGRVKVIIPAVMGEVEAWALPCVPFSGENMGSLLLPEPGAGVWVEFEAGDPSYPIWVGGFWADDQLPQDEQSQTAAPHQKMIRSKTGLLVILDDDAEKIVISDADGQNIMTMAVQEGKWRMKANLKIVLEAPQIELVENARHPLVFGDDLLQYLNQLVQTFNTHLHPGEMAAGVIPVTPAPPVVPMSPAMPSLLSTKVKTD